MVETDKKKDPKHRNESIQKLRIQIAQSKAEKKKHKIKRQDPGMTAPETFFQKPNAAQEESSNIERNLEPFAEALTIAVEEIKQYIHTEIEALKAEIKSLL